MGSLIRSRKVQGQAHGFEELPKRHWGGAGSQINSRTQKQSDSKPLKSSLKYTYKAFLDSKLCLIVDLFLFTLNEERTRVAGVCFQQAYGESQEFGSRRVRSLEEIIATSKEGESGENIQELELTSAWIKSGMDASDQTRLGTIEKWKKCHGLSTPSDPF